MRTPLTFTRVMRNGRWCDLGPDGKIRPVISGGDGAPTATDLAEERTTALNRIDDILNTAQEASRSLTDEERIEHDELVTRCEQIDGSLAEIELSRADSDRYEAAEARRRRYSVPHVNTGAQPAHASRSLDELLWATDEVVRAGSIDKTGAFRQHGTAMNSVEQVVVRSVDDQMVQAPRITEFVPEQRQLVRSFQQTVADMALFGLMVDKSAKSSADGFNVARSHKLTKGRWNDICRALDVDTSSEGIEWVPTGIGATLHERVRAIGKVAPLFSRIDLPTNPWKWPLEGADATAYRVAEPTSDTATKVAASTPGTGAATFDAEIFGARTLFSRSLEADSALAILPYVQRKLVLAFVTAEERAVINGDTDGTHQDSDTNTAGTTDAAWAWDGLRKRGLANTTQATTATTAANLALIRKAMGKWGLNPTDLAFIVGVSAMYAILADTNVLTVDKMGPNATILNGQIASIHGVPIIVSEHVREDLNASGVHDAITTTKTTNICVNRNEWAFGQRMALDVEVDDSIYRETYQRVMVGFMREDFQNIGESSGEDTSIGYNVTP